MLYRERKSKHANAIVKTHQPGTKNLMRVLRRRLGLTQGELGYVIGYEDETNVSRIENGIRTPLLTEVLMIELVFGVPAFVIFPEIRAAVGRQVSQRVKRIMGDLETSSAGHHRRVSYKTAQLTRVLASLRSQDDCDQSGTHRGA